MAECDRFLLLFAERRRTSPEVIPHLLQVLHVAALWLSAKQASCMSPMNLARSDTTAAVGKDCTLIGHLRLTDMRLIARIPEAYHSGPRKGADPMRTMHDAAVLPVVVFLARFFCYAPSAQAEMMVWDAGLGLLPNELSPGWTWEGPTSGEKATITSAVMTIRSASRASDVAAFSQTAGNLSVPADLWIEGRTRWVSGTDHQPNRSHVCILFTTTADVGNSLWIAQDGIFIMTAGGAVGASAAVDTDEAMHTYRITVQGTNAGSPFQVHYDGVPKLEGTLFSNASLHGDVPRVFWGDGTVYEGGVSEWEYLAHNASATPGVWLTMRGDPPGVRVGWSTAAYGFGLQTATNLLSTEAWQDDTNTPVVVGHEKSVSIKPPGSVLFRLKEQ